MTRSDAQDGLTPPMKWNAWGDPAAAKPLSDGIRTLLKSALGVEATGAAEPDPDRVPLRPSALAEADHKALAAIVGERFYRVDQAGRLLHAGGKSTLDLLRRN